MRWLRPVLGVIAGLVVAAPLQIFAQGADARVMTVDEVVARALADNPDLRAVRAEVDAAVGRVKQAGLRPNPMLELGGQKAISPDSNLNIGVTLPLDLNGRVDGRVGVAQRELEMKRAQVAERERRLAADVRLKAGELLAARRNVEVTDELLRINRDGLRLVGDRVREGAAPAIEEKLLLVEVNRLDASRQMLESRLTVMTLQLKALTGMEPDAPLTLRGELGGASPAVTRAEAVAQALAVRPDLEVARADAAMARAKIRKEEAEGRWDASVSVGYQRQDFGFSGLRGVASNGSLQPIQDVFHYFGAGVSITLPVRNRNQGNVAAAVAETQAAERRQQFIVLVVRQEVDAAFTQLEAARRALALYERGVRDVAQRNLEVVRRTWELGRGTLLDVITEQRRLIEIENGYTDALKQVFDATVEIDRAVGLTTTAPRG
jgi:cobalt-zinc-cadmium efflux system outer membrane protein